MHCETCYEYERQIRDLETELKDVEFAKDSFTHAEDKIKAVERIKELHVHLESAKSALAIHRRREGVNV